MYPGTMGQGKYKRDVAVKITHVRDPKNHRDTKGMKLQMIADEVHTWRHVNRHPHICQLLETMSVGQDFWFIMERGNPENLLGLCMRQRNQRLNIQFAKYIFKQVTSGINYMHGRCIAHCDVKLENTLIFNDAASPFGLKAKLADFGLAYIAWDHEHGIIKTNNTAGTIRYQPPEILFQKIGKEVWDQRKGMGHSDTSTDREKTEVTGKPTKLDPDFWFVRKDSAPFLYRGRDFLEHGVTNAMAVDTWALGVVLYVMITGGYLVKVQPALDLYKREIMEIMKGKVIKYKFMPQSCREFIRTMLEPIPEKRATIRCIINHDWMKDNPLMHASRQRGPGNKLSIQQGVEPKPPGPFDNMPIYHGTGPLLVGHLRPVPPRELLEYVDPRVFGMI